MTEADYSPDWGAWQLMSAVTIEAAVALSLAVNPDLLWDWKRQATRDEIKEFQRRLQWAARWSLRGPNSVAVNYLGGTRSVYLVEFVRHANAAGWNLPVQLLTLIAKNEGERPVQLDTPSTVNPVAVVAEIGGANPPSEMPPQTDTVDRPAEPPPGVSKNAYANYLAAKELDPDFAEKYGGKSKVAGRLARNDKNKKEATVLRDLQRVVKALRDTPRQK